VYTGVVRVTRAHGVFETLYAMWRLRQSIIIVYCVCDVPSSRYRPHRSGRWKSPLSLLRRTHTRPIIYCEFVWYRGRQTPMIIIIIIAIMTEWRRVRERGRAYVSKPVSIRDYNSQLEMSLSSQKKKFAVGFLSSLRYAPKWWFVASRQHISAWILDLQLYLPMIIVGTD